MILFKQDSYQRVTLNFGLSYYLSSLGNGFVTFGFQEAGLNCLSEIRAPNKQLKLIVLGTEEGFLEKGSVVWGSGTFFSSVVLTTGLRIKLTQD